MKSSIFLAALTATLIGAPGNSAPLGTSDRCETEQHIVVFSKFFDIEAATQNPIGVTGEGVILSRNTEVHFFEPETDEWRWHCGLKGNSWAGPGGVILDFALPEYSPFLGELFRGIAGNWERTSISGVTRMHIKYRTNGKIDWEPVD
ncbi:MAG: hypothetical protein QNJ44_09915 [Rhodobacter sp.]|nr:hypothetical protein [Rhodobacter sp.]